MDAMSASGHLDLSSGSPDRPLCASRHRGSYRPLSLDRSGSFRENMENPLLSSLPNMSRSSSSVTQGDVCNFFQCLRFDPKSMVVEHKLNTPREFKRLASAAIGIPLEDSLPASSKSKQASPSLDDLRRLKSGLRESGTKARERVKIFNDCLSVINKWFPTVPSRKRSRLDALSDDQPNTYASIDRSVSLLGSGKMGSQNYASLSGLELEQRESEERSKNAIPSKRARTSMVDARASTPARPPGTMDKGSDVIKVSNSSAVQGVDRTLSVSLDGWENSRMKKKRTGIKANAAPCSVATKPVGGDREAKQSMQPRVTSKARSRLTDAYGFRACRPPTRKLSDRKAYTRKKHIATNMAADFLAVSDDGREELLAAANAVIKTGVLHLKSFSSLDLDISCSFVDDRFVIMFLYAHVAILQAVNPNFVVDASTSELLDTDREMPNGCGYNEYEREEFHTRIIELIPEHSAPTPSGISLYQRLVAALISEEENEELLCGGEDVPGYDVYGSGFDVESNIESEVFPSRMSEGVSEERLGWFKFCFRGSRKTLTCIRNKSDKIHLGGSGCSLELRTSAPVGTHSGVFKQSECISSEVVLSANLGAEPHTSKEDRSNGVKRRELLLDDVSGKMSDQSKVMLSSTLSRSEIAKDKNDYNLDVLEEPIDLSGLQLPEMDDLGVSIDLDGQGDDLGSWFNSTDDDGLQDHDYMGGLGVPKDNLADLNMMV
ncbi:UNVERIFIED_CONTAM: hypothetical protein Sradi_5457800 [Sesamum radiatum]|uniref:Uncharacterized protein n=1 Tax=Sesamum radiatum TaxID=300843 RepID=A0AAW2L9D9_SESRA